LSSASGTTGTTSTNLVFSTSPTLVTPTLGAASATSLKPTTAAAFNFLLTGGSNIGSYDTAGAWTLGASSNTPYTQYHTTHANIFSAPSSNSDYNGGWYLGANVYIATSRQPTRQTSLGGAMIQFAPRTTDTNPCLMFYAALSTHGATDSSSIVGQYTQAGAWTFPINTTHTFGNNTGASQLSIVLRGASGYVCEHVYYQNNVLKGEIGITPGGGAIVSGDAAGDLCIATVAGQKLQFGIGGTGNVANCSAGAWTLGPTAANVTHKTNGAMSSIYREYTGGSTRTLSTSPTNYITEYTWVDTFTDLSTSAWSVANGNALGNGILHCALKNVDSDMATFTIYCGVEQGVSHRFTYAAGANASISETSEGVFEISGLGDGRTYTLTGSTANAGFTLKASSTATGTTTLVIKQIRMIP
jgi:hypothetical protein